MTGRNGSWLSTATAFCLAASQAALGAQPATAPVDATMLAQASQPARAVVTRTAATMPNYRAIIEQAAPAVVGVTVAGLRRGGSQAWAPDPDDPFYRFFRGLPGFEFPAPPQWRGDGVPFRSQGSGFIISSDGLVLTNAHVVREAREVRVKLSDRREFRAQVLGADPTTDVAVLRISASDLPTVRLGDAEQLRVGDPVLAIGSPFGFEQSATQGIVSALGRSLPGDASVPFIQTDAAVNPGNSGGPLFDGSGAVVGINAQIYSASGGFQGLSFAIPINVALKVKDQIVATGKASHARLGVTVQDLNQALAESFGLQRPSGALIAGVVPDSAAAQAELQPGDVVTAVDGRPITRAGELSSRIALAAPGDTVRLTVWRNRSERNVTVTLGHADSMAPAKPDAGQSAGDPAQLGLRLRPLTGQEKAETQVTSGLRVEAVAGAAARAGVMPGDVLLSVNSEPVSSVDQVRSVLVHKPKTVALLILREGARIFVPVELD